MLFLERRFHTHLFGEICAELKRGCTFNPAGARAWKTRVKGRDWYDLVWFVGRNVPASLAHLKSRLVQTGHLKQQDVFTIKEARELLSKRIGSLDINAAKKDVGPFLVKNDMEQLAVWSKDFFLDLVNRINFE